MRSLITVVILTQMGFGATISLDELLSSAKQPQQIEEMIEHQFNANESRTLANIQSGPLTLNHALSRSVSPLQTGYEHEIGLSKEFKLGDVQALEKRANRLNNQANRLEQQKLLVGYSNQLKNAYHQYCLDQEYQEHFKKRYETFALLYSKKRRAYEQDEISKRELLQIKLEKQNLQSELNRVEQKVSQERQELIGYGSLGAEDNFSCQDLYPIEGDFSFDDNRFDLTQQAYEKRIQSRQVALERQSKKIDTIELSTGYLRELERDVYTIGISIPLNFTSKKSEYERAALMQESSAIALEKEQTLRNKEYEVKRLVAKLNRNYEQIQAQQQSIEDFKRELLPLVQKSYAYGESTVVEYLLSQQQLRLKEETLLEIKKGYYETLFTLYNISEKR